MTRMSLAVRLFMMFATTVTVIGTSACRRDGRDSGPGQGSIAPASTAAAVWTPELARAIASADRWVDANRTMPGSVIHRDEAHRFGRLDGLLISWRQPGLEIGIPNAFDQIVITPDGRLMQPPFVYPPMLPPDVEDSGVTPISAAQQAIADDAIRVAARDYGPYLQSAELVRATPRFAGFVIGYAWGHVLVHADGTVYKPFGVVGDEGKRFVALPPSDEERTRLDALSAVDVIRSYIQTADDNVKFYLSGIRARHRLLAANTVGRGAERGAVISGLTVKPMGDPATAESPAGTQYGFRVTYWTAVASANGMPPGERGLFCYVGRAVLGGPWRVEGCGTGP